MVSGYAYKTDERPAGICNDRQKQRIIRKAVIPGFVKQMILKNFMLAGEQFPVGLAGYGSSYATGNTAETRQITTLIQPLPSITRNRNTPFGDHSFRHDKIPDPDRSPEIPERTPT